MATSESVDILELAEAILLGLDTRSIGQNAHSCKTETDSNKSTPHWGICDSRNGEEMGVRQKMCQRWGCVTGIQDWRHQDSVFVSLPDSCFFLLSQPILSGGGPRQQADWAVLGRPGSAERGSALSLSLTLGNLGRRKAQKGSPLGRRSILDQVIELDASNELGLGQGSSVVKGQRGGRLPRPIQSRRPRFSL